MYDVCVSRVLNNSDLYEMILKLKSFEGLFFSLLENIAISVFLKYIICIECMRNVIEMKSLNRFFSVFTHYGIVCGIS